MMRLPLEVTFASAPGSLVDGVYGDITVSTGTTVWTINNGVVTNVKLATMAANTVKANATALAATPTDIALSASQLFGRGATGDLAPIVLGTNLSMAGTTLNAAAGGGGISDGDKGDITVTGSGLTWTIDAGVVTLAKQANVATARIMGRVTAATGVQEALTGTQATTLLDPFTSALKGLAPASGGGTANFLRADGTWVAPAGGGDMVLATAQTNTGLKTFLDTTFGLRNVLNTFTATLTNAITAARVYTLKDASGTLAFTSDITGVNSGTNTGDQTSIVGISGTKAQFDTAVSDGNIQFVGDAPTAHTHLLAAGATDVTVTAANLNALDDGLNTALHFHDADRARGVHTGTQLAATVSDFSAAADARIAAASINALADVIITAPSATQVLKFNGTNWINDTDATGGGGYTHPNHSGDVTSVGDGAQTIAADVVTNAKLANVNSATFKGRVTAAVGDPEDLTATQATSLLNLATISVKGLAPVLSNVATQFLNGTGAYSTPAGGGAPGGATLQVQFNNAGAFAGAANVEIESNNLKLISTTTPAAPTAGAIIFSKLLAGRNFPHFIGASNEPRPFQVNLLRSGTGIWMPSGAGTVAPGLFGFQTFTITGFTATARSCATTNYFTRRRRQGYVTAATAAAVGQWRAGNNCYTMGDGAGVGGFSMTVRFGCSDAATVAGARQWMGMGPSSVAPTNVEPSTLVQRIGVGHGAADTNLKIFYGGSVAQTPIDLGVNFPANTLSVDMYELSLYAPPNSAVCHYEVTRLNTGHVATGTLSGAAGTVLPNSTNLMSIVGYRTNNATALACGWDVCGATVEMADE